ncbi:HD domain-containing protein [Haloarculaceae archaeon H-GB11]|nr:HD domain-containing protein [Haloarculaceae archaeon H-GB11]
MTDELRRLARRLSLPYYDDALPAHDSFHANRVRDLALRLATDCERSVDTDVLLAAAWLHDIGRPLERTGEIDHHDEWAAAEAATLLRRESIPDDRIEAIQHCIRTHSIRDGSPDPETIEAELLFDADKLEAGGASGILRLACIVGERSGTAGEKRGVIDDTSASRLATTELPDVTHLRAQARKRLDELYTAPGRRLGETRRRFMEDFFARFRSELGAGAEQPAVQNH